MSKEDHFKSAPTDVQSCLCALDPYLLKKSEFQEIIFAYFRKNNPLQFALNLLIVCAKRKHTNLPVLILEALKEYCKLTDISHLLTRKQKLEAYDVVLMFSGFNMYVLIFEIFELQDEREYILAMTRHLLSQKKFKEAFRTISVLDLENEFEAKDCVFPLFFLGYENMVRTYLTKCPSLQIPFVQTLDSLCRNPFSVNEFLRSIGLEGYQPRSGPFEKKWLMKRLTFYVDLFNVDIKTCPNLYQQRVWGAMCYLVRKMYTEESISYAAFEEMVIDTVRDHPEIQIDLLLKLVYLDDTSAAIKIAQELHIPRDNWPQVLRNIFPDAFAYEPVPYDCDYLTLRLNRSDIIFVTTQEQFNAAVNDIAENYDAVGVDAEWKPNMGIFKEKAALLQLATWDTVYLIDILALNCNVMLSSWDHMLKRIFCNPQILKLGYGLSHDLEVVTKTLVCGKHLGEHKYTEMVDLTDFFTKLKNNFPELYDKIEKWHPATSDSKKDSKGLSHSCRIVLGKALNKNEQFSNWERRPLRENQVTYAALDSYCLLMLHERLYGFLKEHDLSLDAVLNSKNSPAASEKSNETVPQAVPISEFKVVVDYSANCVVKFLRLLGADVISLDADADQMEAVKIALAEKCYIVTSKANYKKIIGYYPKAMCYCVKPNVLPKTQVLSMLKLFGVECKDTDLFSRCTICNGVEYIKVDRKELFSHLDKGSGDKVKIGHKINSVFKCDITDVEGKVHRDQYIKLAPCSDQVQHFLICCRCGKAYWEGSHKSRYANSLSHILDAAPHQTSDL